MKRGLLPPPALYILAFPGMPEHGSPPHPEFFYKKKAKNLWHDKVSFLTSQKSEGGKLNV